MCIRDSIILAVKPWLIKPVVSELKLKSKQILISVAAGIPFEELAHYCLLYTSFQYDRPCKPNTGRNNKMSSPLFGKGIDCIGKSRCT